MKTYNFIWKEYSYRVHKENVESLKLLQYKEIMKTYNLI
jgi:hypothetical protein